MGEGERGQFGKLYNNIRVRDVDSLQVDWVGALVVGVVIVV